MSFTRLPKEIQQTIYSEDEDLLRRSRLINKTTRGYTNREFLRHFCDKPISAKEFENYINRMRPINVIVFFYSSPIYNPYAGLLIHLTAYGYLRADNDIKYNSWKKGLVHSRTTLAEYKSVITLSNKVDRNAKLTPGEITRDLYAPYREMIGLDLLTMFRILSLRGCIMERSPMTTLAWIEPTEENPQYYAKQKILEELRWKMQSIIPHEDRISEYFELCCLYFYLRINAELMNLPFENYQADKRIRFDTHTGELVNGLRELEVETTEIKRIIDDLYTEIENYIDLL